jgi:phage terminase large subunit
MTETTLDPPTTSLPDLPIDEIVLPYKPRRHFIQLHESKKRFKFAVCHRRAGKTVALVNTLIAAALNNPRADPPPRYAYIGPSFDQAKDLCWQYLKTYTNNIPGIRALEGELSIVFPGGATIRLYGGALAYERMRGIYLDGAVLDEYPLLNPQAWTSVVRPCLADYRGFAIISGTSNGDDHFHAVKLKAEDDPQTWDVFDIKITDTGAQALSYEEVEDMRRDMSPDEFAREMLNSFQAPVEGAYYTEALNVLQMQNRVTRVTPDLNTSVLTSWDLGMRHLQCVWLFQIAGRELHWIDYIEGRGKALSHYTDLLGIKAKTHGFRYRAHLLPHDVEVRELATGHSRRHELTGLLAEPVITVPNHSTEDGISATRAALGVSWFDEEATRRGLARLRSYRRGKSGQAIPDEAEDAADAFRTGCVGIPMVSSASFARSGRLRRRIRGLV